MRHQILFSIIVPTYRRPTQRLHECLSALASQTLPKNLYEVIVVDDGSHVSSEDMTKPFFDRLNSVFLTQSRTGPAAARNYGAKVAKGNFLAFTDDDCEPAPDWLEKLGGELEKNPECIVGGPVINALPLNRYSTTSQSIVDHLYEYFNRDPRRARFLAGDNFALSAETFQQVGGFHPSFFLGSEDRELCQRLLDCGRRLIYVPDAVVYHSHELTLASFLRQHYHYGCGGGLYYFKIRHSSDPKTHRLRSVKFYAGLLRRPFLQSRDLQSLAVSGLIILSQLAYATGFVQEAVSNLKTALQRPTSAARK